MKYHQDHTLSAGRIPEFIREEAASALLEALMRVDTVGTSPITMSTVRGPTFNIATDKPYYKHLVRWDPQGGCPEGFVVQKIERDMKYSFGEVGAGARWQWEQEVTLRGSYWEIWEVVDAALGNGNARRMRVYPAVVDAVGVEMYATSHGLQLKVEIDGDTQKRPAAAPENHDYLGHDLFAESRPKIKTSMAIKGTFKIKGTVYFLPNRTSGEHPWVTGFLGSARRNRRFAISNGSCYTGGPLWQREGDLAAPPGATRIISRYEAGEFYDVQVAHFSSSCINPPANNRYCRSRPYPGQADNVAAAAAAGGGP